MRSSRLALLALLGAFAPAALAMNQITDQPTRTPIPWATNSGAPYVRNIPNTSQIGVQSCAASFPDGFPPLTFVPASAGGCPPFGADFNGIFQSLSRWSRWNQAGGGMYYDPTFSAAVGGYPRGAVVQSNVLFGRTWISITNSNTTDPDDRTGASSGWEVLPGTNAPGQLLMTLNNVAPPISVSANGTSVGDISSNASGRRNDDTYWLFVRLWTDCPNTTCQLFNSSGGAISRGASANADWAAHNAIATYPMSGAAVIAADSQNGGTTSNLVGVPVVAGSRTVAGSVLGENLHTLSLSEIPTGIDSTVSTSVSTSVSTTVSATVTGVTVSSSGNSIITTNGVPGNQRIDEDNAGPIVVPLVVVGQQFLFPTTLSQTGTGSATGTGTGTGTGSGSGTAVSSNTGGGASNNVPRSFLVQYWLSL